MYGWRARIGFIGPSASIDTPAYEFYRMAPDGVAMVGTIMGIRILTDDDIERALQALDRVAAQYSREKVDIVNLGGSPPVILAGKDSEKMLIERMQKNSGILSTTSQTGAVKALKALGVSKLALASPFDEHQNRKLKTYLEASGFKVGGMGGLAVPLSEMAFLPTEKSYVFAREVVRQADEDINGIYLPCAKWPTVETIAALEADTGLPVVTSIQAMLWHCLRMLGLGDRIEGFGKLFEIGSL